MAVGCGPYLHEKNRLDTFLEWPSNMVTKENFADTGLYYTGKQDVVRCAYCQVEISEWEDGDSPSEEHRKFSPRCPYVRQIFKRKAVPTPLAHQTIDACDFVTHGAEDTKLTQEFISQLGIEKHQAVAYPQYITHESRLKSFEIWPVSIKQKPEDLAAAGFFYTGTGDRTICFHCGIGLKDWQESDEQWEEHALWSSDCTFLRKHKSDEFIKEVCGRHGLKKESFASNVSAKKSEELTVKQEATTEKRKSTSGELMCGICLSKERSILYLPCKHLFACEDCGPTVSDCPVCRKKIEASTKIYPS